MSQLPELIQDLSLILVVAGIVSVAFKKLKQPVVLGYIMAGLLVGPNITLFPTITDLHGIKTWGEIGVIFLLFALGLEFSFKKLLHVGGAATVTALIEVVMMLLIGFLTGYFLGWSKIDGLFLGGILAISSTTIIIRAFEELGIKGNRFVGLIFGILIVEDLVAILLLAILSTVAMGQKLQGLDMLHAFVRLSFFLTLWFVSGIFFVPTFIKKLKVFVNDEIMLIVSMGLCFLMVMIATKAGFSPALGAFVMGSILAESTEAEKIEELIRPVKNLFAAIFFVSVGMLINPHVIMEYGWLMVLISLITIIGKAGSTMFGAMIAGQGLKQSIQSGMSLAQIGEFSFIIAGLGQSLNVTSDFLYPLAVGVSVLTTFFTPYMIQSSGWVYLKVDKHLPKRWKVAIEDYGQLSKGPATANDWSSLIRNYLIRIVFNGVIITAIFLLTAKYILPLLGDLLKDTDLANIVGLVMSLVFSIPFIWAFAIGSPKDKKLIKLWRGKSYRSQILTVEILRILLAIVLGGFLASQFIPFNMAIGMILFLCTSIFFIFSRYLDSLYNWFEHHFLQNLTEREGGDSGPVRPLMTPWDSHIVHFDVDPASEMVGQTLGELKIRRNFGVTVTLIARGQIRVTAPTSAERIYPFDRIYILGTDEQILHFREKLEQETDYTHSVHSLHSYSLHKIRIPSSSTLCTKSILESRIKEKVNGQVVGIERGAQRIVNPAPDETILPGDILWVVGDGKYIKRLRKLGECF